MAKVTVIGGVNMDIGGSPHKEIIMKDSNLGSINYSFGGVGRNIAHNMKLMGLDVALVGALSHDIFGEGIQKHLNELGIDISNCFYFDKPTSTYLFITDGLGDMFTAINDMSIQDELSPECVAKVMNEVNKSEYIVLDTNIRQDTLEYILENATVPCVIDGVSTTKVVKVANKLDKIHTLKINALEAEKLTGISPDVDNFAERASNELLGKGLKRCLISLGSDGAYIADSNVAFTLRPIKTDVKNPTGAGDAMLGGLVYGMARGYDLEKCGKTAVASSHIALLSYDTVNEEMSASLIEQLI